METSRPLAGLTYAVQCFGCQMNEHEAERCAGILEAAGALLSSDIKNADIAVFMTCCVREKADTRLYASVQALKSAPLPSSKKRTICVGGCIAQRDGEALVQKTPIVNVVFGTQALNNLVNLIVQSRKSLQKTITDTSEAYEGFSTDLPVKRKQGYAAWVPIMYGCNNFCTYCIVPYVRGRERSRPLKSIVEEVKSLIRAGYKEVCLLGQNVNSYGTTLYGNPRFAELLEQVANTGIERIRFTSSHPKDLTEDIISVMARHNNIANHLHLAVQSGSDKVLKAMGRNYTAYDYLKLVDLIRSKMDSIALTTDIIVGFPTESEKDFIKTLELVRKAQFSSAYTFIYSKRAGTKAASMPSHLTKDEVQNRFERLVELIKEQSFAYNQGFSNKEVRVLVEGPSKTKHDVYTGHSSENIVVNFDRANANSKDLVGTFQNVKISSARTWYLKGELLQSSTKEL